MVWTLSHEFVGHSGFHPDRSWSSPLPFPMCVHYPFQGQSLTIIQKEYASEIAERLGSFGLFADVDNGADTLPKKIRNGEIAQYNFILGMDSMTIMFSLTESSASCWPRRTRCTFGQCPQSR